MAENNLPPNAADAKTPEQPEDLLHHLECELNGIGWQPWRDLTDL